MSTHAVVKIYEADGTPVVAIYKHSDGDAFLEELQGQLDKVRVVNGIPYPLPSHPIVNGMDDLAATIVAEWKDGPGEVYLGAIDRWDLCHSQTLTVKPRADGTLEQTYGHS